MLQNILKMHEEKKDKQEIDSKFDEYLQRRYIEQNCVDVSSIKRVNVHKELKEQKEYEMLKSVSKKLDDDIKQKKL